MTKHDFLEQLSGIGIIIQDLRLFLDVNPTNQAAMADFKMITTNYRNLVAQYEQSYGPLTGSNDTNGTWATQPWPWHPNAGGNV
jgi:hypothetical protein